MRHVMLDLETLACNRDAVIGSIGARRFDPLGEFVTPPNEVEFKEVDEKIKIRAVAQRLGISFSYL